MLQHALKYAKMGWHVLPLRGKIPLTPNGVKDASNDFYKILNWFTNNQNIGIACGEVSGITVIDVDGPEGIKSINSIISREGKESVISPTAKTKNGFHLYFRFNESCKNNVRILPGLDIRTTGGYVVAPPSIHPDGGTYEWTKRNLDLPFNSVPETITDKFIPIQNGVAKDWSAIAGVHTCTGSRNSSLTSVIGAIIRSRIDEKLGYALAYSYNKEYMKPALDDQEVDKIWNSVYMIEQRKSF